ncbi:MAG: hypothetical protein K2Y20_14025 [Sphingomonas sp.]|nr:hypothetical protein [Sphingomonas sp.]
MISNGAKDESNKGRRRADRPDVDRIRAVRQWFDRTGKTVADWARENGESADATHKVLSGKRACTTGAQHRIAVKLGLKDTPITEPLLEAAE